MIKRLISFLLTFVLLVAIPLEARYRYNPYTAKLDYYEAAEDVDLGDLGDLTLTGLATGNVLYYNGTAWVNLATGANAEVLTLAAGIPSWAAGGAPAAHAASHEVGGADLVDHDQLTNYLAAQHLTLPNTLAAVLTDHNAAAHVALGFLALPSTIAAVLTDHNKAAHDALLIDADTVDGEHAAAIVTNARVKAHFPDTIANILSDHNLLAHTALGLYDAPGDVDHDLTTNYVANQHTDHTAVTFSAAGLITGGGTLAANRTFTLTEATIESAIDTLANLTSIQGQTVTFSGSLNVEANSNINQDVTSDGTPTFGGLIVTDIFSYDYITEHVLLLGYLAGQDLAAGGTYHVYIGESAGLESTTNDYNVGIGFEALKFVTTGGQNVGIGYTALSGLDATATTFTQNVGIGYRAGDWIKAGATGNLLIGSDAGRNVQTASYNVYIGTGAGYYPRGDNNVAIGPSALHGAADSTAANNIAIGNSAAFDTTTGASDNISIGHSAGYWIEDGDSNIMIGRHAGMGSDGNAKSNNVIIGYDAAEDITTGSSNVVIGYMAGETNLTNGNNQLWIANSNTATPLIYGEFDTSLLKFTATNVGVVGITNLGDGGATNYASFAADGTFTLAGTAKANVCFQFANASLGKGSVAPDEIIVGNYWGWSYDINDDSVFTIKLPDDYASGTDVEIHIRWAVNEAYITNSGEVQWQATWSAHPADASEAIDDAGTTDDSGDINIPATAYFLTQTLIETIPGGSLSAGDEIGITIKRIALVGGADPVADPVVTCVGFIYTVDKLGT